MPLRLGDHNEVVKRWRIVMAARFAGYAKIWGPLPGDTDVFGPRAVAWQKEYQVRTKQATSIATANGEVSDADLLGLGISTAPLNKGLLFTVHGTGMADPLGPGLPADTARQVLDLYEWQPIGNYPAATFPMWPSILKGIDELRFQINRFPDRDINMAGYSQGAVVVGYVLKHDIMDPAGSLHHRLKDVRKVVFWGNPMREKNIVAFDEWIHPVAEPGTHGILEDRLEGLENAPFEVRDYSHKGDMYSAITDDNADEYKVMIQKIVFKATDFFTGEDSVVSQLREFTTAPISEGIAAVQAAIGGISFFTHLDLHNYNIGPAIAFLRS